LSLNELRSIIGCGWESLEQAEIKSFEPLGIPSPFSSSPSGTHLSSRFDNLVYLLLDKHPIPVQQLEHVFSKCIYLRGFWGSIRCDHDSTDIVNEMYHHPRTSGTEGVPEENNVAVKKAFAKAKNLEEAHVFVLADLVSVLEALAHVRRISVICHVGPPLESTRDPPSSRTEVLRVDFWGVLGANVETAIRTLQHVLRASCVIKSPPKSGLSPYIDPWWGSFDDTLRFSPLSKDAEVDSQTLDQNLLDTTTA
jgi:hypothetical protein